MKFTWGLVIVIALGVSLSSCFDPPQYSVVPEIEFEGLSFVETPGVDSLILFIKFRDGDGNLGLDPSENGCYIIGGDTVCYNEKFYFQDRDNNNKLINYEDKRTNPNLSSLPDFVPPYSCINWEVVKENDVVKDTVYFELNPDHYNIFIDFLVKQNDGSFEVFDWRTEFEYPGCATSYDGRFPILAKNGDLSIQSPVEGTLKYGMVSSAFILQFSIKTLKLRIQIQDRLLNRSNVIETPEFQFK